MNDTTENTTPNESAVQLAIAELVRKNIEQHGNFLAWYFLMMDKEFQILMEECASRSDCKAWQHD